MVRLLFLLLLFVPCLFYDAGARVKPAAARNSHLSPQEKIHLKEVRFQKYWNRGKAELNKYSLKQARYGSTFQGEAILIFVTEDFLTKKMVKNETRKGRDSQQALNFSLTRKFITGIYDYSTMTSVFTPTALDKYENTWKVSASSQEWCGHMYAQLTLDGDEYELTSHSYFEEEVFDDYDLDAALLEDEIMARIRVSAESLPVGKVEVIPPLLDARLRHFRLSEETAVAKRYPNRIPGFPGRKLMTYEVKYTSMDRTFKVIYEKNFPHRIAGFVEDTPHIGKSRNRAITRAVRTHSIITDYWNKNQPRHILLRKKLGL